MAGRKQELRMKIWRMIVGFLAAAGFLCSPAATAQMVAGKAIPNFNETMGTDKNEVKPYSCQFISSTAPGNILWPGEQAEFKFQLVNNSDASLTGKGKVELIAYGTKGRPGDIWVPDMFRMGVVDSVPIDFDIAPKTFQNFTVKPNVPAKLGPYALVVDLGAGGRRFVNSFVRTFKADARPVHFPQLAIDVADVDVLTRLGACPNRLGLQFKATSDPEFGKWFDEQCGQIDKFKNAKLPITVEFGAGNFYGKTQPLDRPRPWLDDNGVMKEGKFDLAWLPSYDADFKKLVKMFLAKYGWPRGPIIAVKFMNEPWEGISISGWMADMPRYREIFTALCEATVEARNEYKVEVLIGGCDSSSNTFDKLFSDGNDDFLKYLDFCSIHYQGMNPPSTVKAWVDRKGAYGRVKIWDTESWVANTDDRVAAVMATNLSTGHDRAVGVYGGNICTEWYSAWGEIFGDDGKKKRIPVIHTWSVAASVGASMHFIGQRTFKELLFKNGLPWVMVFEGLPDASGKVDPEDGTVVVVGDIGEEFGHDNILFSNARGFKEIENKPVLMAKLAALSKDAPGQERKILKRKIRHETLSGASMTLAVSAGEYALYDFYGNPMVSENGKIEVPLDGRGFFLRGDGKPGSFALLLDAIRSSRVDGIEPLAKKCRDMLSPVDKDGSVFRLELTNVLNRPVKGTLTVSVKNMEVKNPAVELSLGPNETRTLAFKVSGKPSPDNTYPLSMLFDAGADGKSAHEEDLHVNMIAKRTITVDGKLDDWNGVLPQTVKGDGETGPTLTEQAWLPMVKFDKTGGKGFANGYLAYDDKCFYFAARVADTTPDGGTLRFETRDDDQFYYPEACQGPKRDLKKGDPVQLEELAWPGGVRRYSYRKNPILPSGNAPSFDNVQIAFNVLDQDKKPWLTNPPGTMPGYIGYKDTDYEYALNKVAEKFGGGTEIWRLEVPGMPRKNFYPRQPKSPLDGPVKDGKLVVVQDPTTRVVECAIPWTEIPDVKKKLDAGEPVKFSFRVNDDKDGGCLELSKNRSIAKRNASFHADWIEHWANELEFGFEK